MKKLIDMRKLILVIAVSIMALTVIGILVAASTQGTRGGRDMLFTATLVGGQEVTSTTAPSLGITTTTRGGAAVRFNRSLTRATFRLAVRNGTGITQAHIHCSKAGENGGPVAFFFQFNPSGIAVDGKLASGVLTNANIMNNTCGIVNIASLAMMTLDGGTYVNVHSIAHPPGEIRGQLLKE